jgi:hypothetical protein
MWVLFGSFFNQVSRVPTNYIYTMKLILRQQIHDEASPKIGLKIRSLVVVVMVIRCARLMIPLNVYS